MSYEEYSKKFDEIYANRIEPNLKEIEDGLFVLFA